jgi:phospholipid-binding lipoprotein MlaA
VRLHFIVLLLFSVWCVQCSSSQQKASPLEKSPSVANVAALGEQSDDDADSEPELVVHDPYEGYNRKIHAFNDFFFHYGIYPLASGWNFITPRFLRVGLDNFITWAYTPGRLINNLLQAKLAGAGKETLSFAINGTMGGLGVYNASREIFALDQTVEDSDQTLGKWGISEGAYIVWPFIGPRTVRGTFGFAGDLMLQPQAVIVPVYIQPENIWVQGAIIATTYSVRAVNQTSLDPDAYDNLMKDSIDPYAFLRDIYLQNTRKNVAD